MKPGPDSRRRHLVVIGASAGGVETLVRVVGGLPADLPATVCVVLHLAPGSPSALPAILDRSGPLPCHSAVDGEPLRDGEIIVAPPDRHLVVAGGRVSLTLGPRENGHRPSVDALFRSAAGPDDYVIGVVLSGTRDDGTAGLAAIRAGSGMAIVQDPAEALYPGMPASALAHAGADVVAPSAEIAAAIVRAVGGGLDPVAPSGVEPSRGEGPGAPAGLRSAAASGAPNAGPNAVNSTCPECGGVLTEQVEAGVTQWRCRVGHRYSPESLADAQAEGVEGALWAAVRALEDREALLTRIADHFAAGDHGRSASAFRRRARQAGRQAEVVRTTLGEGAAGIASPASELRGVG